MQPTGMRYRLVIEARYKPNTALLGVLDAVRTSAEIKVGIETGRPHVKIQGSEEHDEKRSANERSRKGNIHRRLP